MLGILANGPTWEICPKKKKKNPSINQCGEKGSGGGITYPPDLSIWTIQNQKIKN